MQGDPGSNKCQFLNAPASGAALPDYKDRLVLSENCNRRCAYCSTCAIRQSSLYLVNGLVYGLEVQSLIATL